MKKIILIALATLLVFSFASCADEPDATVTPNDTQVEEPGYDPRFDSKVEEVADCYFSLLTEDGFGNYLLAFPTEFVEGYQKELEYDDATFEEAINNATYTLHVNRDEKYAGYEFHIEYNEIDHKEVSAEDAAALIKDLSMYCYMTPSNIEKVMEYTYDVVTYGWDPDNEQRVMEEQENKKLTMLYIKEEGWFVSPTNFELP